MLTILEQYFGSFGRGFACMHAITAVVLAIVALALRRSRETSAWMRRLELLGCVSFTMLAFWLDAYYVLDSTHGEGALRGLTVFPKWLLLVILSPFALVQLRKVRKCMSLSGLGFPLLLAGCNFWMAAVLVDWLVHARRF